MPDNIFKILLKCIDKQANTMKIQTKTRGRKRARKGSQEGRAAFILRVFAEFGDLENLFL